MTYRISMNILKDWRDKRIWCTKRCFFFETQRLEIQTSMTCKLLLRSFPRTVRNVPSHVSTSCPPTICWMCWVMAPRLRLKKHGRDWRAATAISWGMCRKIFSHPFAEATSLPRCIKGQGERSVCPRGLNLWITLKWAYFLLKKWYFDGWSCQISYPHWNSLRFWHREILRRGQG